MRPRFLPAVLTVIAICVVAFLPEARAQVYISEFLAESQLNAQVDEDGEHSDWIELWNSGSSAVSLNGWYLTDDANDLRKWQFPTTTPVVTIPANGRLLLFASSKNRRLDAAKLHTNFKLDKGGEYLGLVRANGLTVEHSYAPTFPPQVQDVAYGIPVSTTLTTLVPAGAMGRAKVPLSAADMPLGWNALGYDDSTWQQGATGFGFDTGTTFTSLIGAGANLQASMYNVNSLAMVRIVFNVATPASIASLKLSMKYDDGFVCYLNGTVVMQQFAPGSVVWNSASTLDRNDGSALVYQTPAFSVANVQNYLLQGDNVLAFQILNSAATNNNAVLLPLLEGTVSAGIAPPNYLQTATPNAVNSAVRATLGPNISKTTGKLPGQSTSVSPRPTGDVSSVPIIVTTKIVPTLRPLATSNPVQLKYAVMFNAESSLNMVDDGTNGDVIAGDGTYTAQIPTINAGVGQMIRWRVVATDNGGAVMTDPPYLDPTDNEKYYGTVTADGIITSLLPVLHWFITDTDLASVEAGDNNYVRPSVFFLDRFYDNVRLDRHGQSTSGFVKKSYNFNFNQDNRFTWKVDESNVKAINLLTNWADKTKVRNQVAWETWENTGHIASHWNQIVRVQKNGVFRATYDMGENGDDKFLERKGLDPLGSFYKVYNSLENTTVSVGGGNGIEKKTGYPITDVSDLAALEAALNTGNSLATRRQWSYDNVDVPTMVNYLANNILLLNNDFGHKNYYIYRDTFGSREWSLFPWDQDLGFGHTWTGSQNYFNDDIDSQRGLNMGAAGGNRLMNLIMNSAGAGTQAPEMVAMCLRRLRTLMDQKLISATATDGPFEQRMTQLIDQLDPVGAAYATDADLDLQKWGYWVDGSGAAVSPNTPSLDAATNDHGVRKQILRILDNPSHTGNPIPPNPGAVNNAEGLGNTTFAYLTGRRSLLYTGNQTLNNAPIPGVQPAVPTGLTIEYVDARPASGNPMQEFFIIRNNSADYVDVSGWKVTGEVGYTFRGGTVIPPFTSGSAVAANGDVHAGRLHVARDAYQFRQRAASPRGNEYRLVVGGYSGQLTARGGTINLVIPGATPAQDVSVASTTYPGNPTQAQNFLRITELNYDPVNPTAAELASLPGVQASDFEFLELTNTGSTALSLGGAYFSNGITFTFSTGYSLQAGQRCVIVSLLAAFNLRYGASGALVAGQYEGNLDNNGETLQLLDSVGETVLKFRYDPLWFGLPDYPNPAQLKNARGYSLVTRSTAPAWDGYETPTNWALGGNLGGTPGTGETAFSDSFVGWRKTYFSTTEETDSLLAGPTADPDGDGRTNFDEFIFGGNPRVPETKPLPTTSIVNVDGTNYLAITFDRRHNALDSNMTIESSADLTTWIIVNLPVGAPTPLANGLDRVTYRDSEPAGSGTRYLRVRAVR